MDEKRVGAEKRRGREEKGSGRMRRGGEREELRIEEDGESIIRM